MELKKLRIGLRAKALFGLVIPLTLLFIFFTLSNEQYLSERIREDYRSSVTQALDSTVNMIRHHTEAEVKDDPELFLGSMRRVNAIIDQIVVFSESGDGLKVLAKSQKNNSRISSDSFYRRPLGSGRQELREAAEHFEIASRIRFKDKSEGVLAVRVDLNSRDELVESMRNRSISLLGIGLLFLSVIIYFGLELSFLGPLRKLHRATLAVEDGEFATSETLDRNDEIGDLTSALFDMTRRLSEHASDLEKRVGEITILFNISKVASLSLDLDEALNIVLESAVKVTGAAGGAILLNEERDVGGKIALSRKVSFESSKTAGGAFVSQEIADFVAEKNEPLLLIGDIARLGFKKQEGLKDAIYAPINHGDQLVGIIGLVNKWQKNFIKKDLQLLITLANQASGVIQTARLFEDLQASYLSTIRALAAAVDAKDPYTQGHSSRVAGYSELVAKKYGASSQDVRSMKIAAYLHDVGKIGVSERLLHKRSELTDEERQAFREHPTISARIVENVPFLKEAKEMIAHHHEYFNGEGYPDGLVGEQIPLGARIIIVADAFDAMTSDRPYRQALDLEEAREELKRCAGSQFDPDIVRLFVEHVDSAMMNKKEFEAISFLGIGGDR